MPSSPRASSYFPHHAESFLPEDGALQRKSTYLRHIQSELNIHGLQHDVRRRSEQSPRTIAMRRGHRGPGPTPLRTSTTFGDSTQQLSIAQSGDMKATSNAVELEGDSPLSPRTHAGVTEGVPLAPPTTRSGEFSFKGRKYSLLPTIAARSDSPTPRKVDPLRAHQFRHWRSYSMPPSPPVFPELQSGFEDLPEVVSNRFYVGARTFDDTAYGIERKSKQRPRFNRFLKKLSSLLYRKR